MNAAPELIEGRVETILPSGEAVVRCGKQVLLVANAVPGDQLLIRPLAKRRGARRGEIAELRHPSAYRIDAPCSVAARCGGCALQYLPVEYQAELKSQWVRQAFADLVDDGTQWIPAAASQGLRRRLRWTVGHDDHGPFLGFQGRASHQPVRQQECLAITGAMLALRRLLERTPSLLRRAASVQALQLCDGMHVVIECERDPEGFAPPFTEVAGLPVQWWSRVGEVTRPLTRPVLQLHDRLPAGERDILLQVGPDDFVQGQAEGNAELIRQIQSWAGAPKRIGDLFCGIGNLSLPLAAACGAQVYGAEANRASVLAARRNADRLKLAAEYVQLDLFGEFDTAPFAGLDLLILDPPRKGARRVCERMGRMLPKQIIMVSCDAAAGARDGATLSEQGYRMQALRALDLFPYAGHVEAVSLWSMA